MTFFLSILGIKTVDGNVWQRLKVFTEKFIKTTDSDRKSYKTKKCDFILQQLKATVNIYRTENLIIHCPLPSTTRRTLPQNFNSIFHFSFAAASSSDFLSDPTPLRYSFILFFLFAVIKIHERSLFCFVLINYFMNMNEYYKWNKCFVPYLIRVVDST